MTRHGVIDVNILGFIPPCNLGATQPKVTKNQKYPIQILALPMGMNSVSTQNVPKVVKGKLQGNSKTTLERNWYFLPERDLSINILIGPDIKQYLNICMYG